MSWGLGVLIAGSCVAFVIGVLFTEQIWKLINRLFGKQ